jgi:hypothetical protein
MFIRKTCLNFIQLFRFQEWMNFQTKYYHIKKLSLVEWNRACLDWQYNWQNHNELEEFWQNYTLEIQQNHTELLWHPLFFTTKLNIWGINFGLKDLVRKDCHAVEMLI